MTDETYPRVERVKGEECTECHNPCWATKRVTLLDGTVHLFGPALLAARRATPTEEPTDE